MSAYSRAERGRQSALKQDASVFTTRATGPRRVMQKGRELEYAHMLPIGAEAENLFAEFRDDALSMFAALGIGWHQGGRRTPSPNLLSSQVCAANFLMPFVHDQSLATVLFKPLIPDL